METSHLKNSLIAAVIAVIAGVITLGANVAFGVDVPKQDPSTSGLVAPTFSGLDVRGDIKNDTVAKAPVTFNDGDGVALKVGDLDIQLGSIVNGLGNFIQIKEGLKVGGQIGNINNGMVEIMNGLKVLAGGLQIDTGGIKVTGGIQDPSSKALEITDVEGLLVTGNTNLSGTTDVNVAGGTALLKLGPAIGNWMGIDQSEIATKGDDLYLNYDSGQNVHVGGGAQSNLTVGGNVKIGDSSDTVKKSLDVYGDMNVLSYASCPQGQDCPISAAQYGNLYVGGKKVVLNPHEIKNINNDTMEIRGNKNLYLNSFSSEMTLRGDGYIDIVGAMRTKNTAENLRFADNVSIDGKVTAAGGFGTYTRRQGTFLSIAPNDIAEASVACLTGEIIVSCGGQGSNSLTYSKTKDVSFTNLDPYAGTCFARGSNKNTAQTRYVSAIAMCFNPAQ